MSTKRWMIVFLLGCSSMWAQGEAVSARLAGTVLDPDESPVPQARVFTAVPPGRYQVKVEKDGFLDRTRKPGSPPCWMPGLYLRPF